MSIKPLNLDPSAFTYRFLETKDFSHSQESFVLIKHQALDLLRTDPVPADLANYYEGRYISHKDEPSTLMDRIYQMVKKLMLGRKYKNLSPWLQVRQNALDIGAGSGEWMRYLKKHGWKVEGIEPNDKARLLATEKGLSVHADISDQRGRSYDLISMWHVLEHLEELLPTIQRIKSLLGDNGILVVAVPNYRSYDAQHYKQHWAAYDVPRHIWHFSRNAIHQIFNEQGFEVLEEQPLIFDAYYVSLLSEQYKNQKSKPLTALLNGFKSNWKARRSGEYSSITYVLTKRS